MEEHDVDISVLHNSSVDDDGLDGNSRLVTDMDLSENIMLDNFLSNVEDPGFLCDGENEIDEEYSFSDEIPTTDASDEIFLLNELTEYGGTLSET
eukprot:14384805-Ditylum_brightwellii.AAC.1